MAYNSKINRPGRGEFYGGSAIHLTPPTKTQKQKRAVFAGKGKSLILSSGLRNEFDRLQEDEIQSMESWLDEEEDIGAGSGISLKINEKIPPPVHGRLHDEINTIDKQIEELRKQQEEQEEERLRLIALKREKIRQETFEYGFETLKMIQDSHKERNKKYYSRLEQMHKARVEKREELLGRHGWKPTEQRFIDWKVQQDTHYEQYHPFKQCCAQVPRNLRPELQLQFTNSILTCLKRLDERLTRIEDRLTCNELMIAYHGQVYSAGNTVGRRSYFLENCKTMLNENGYKLNISTDKRSYTSEKI